MKRAVVIMLGAWAGFLVAAELPIWPLLYADIGRNGSLVDAYDYPEFGNQAWVLPLCIAAACIGAGEIAMRRFDQRLSDRIRRKRLTRGLCARCGYNLTGNASGICPECGTPVPL